jgi:TonB family protein
MHALILFSLFLLTACSGTKAEIDQEEAREAAAATDQCLTNPALARDWGECNVKATIYDRIEALDACDRQHGRKAKGAMILKIRVTPQGRVKDVKADDSGVKNPPLEKCLGRVIAKMKFAPPPRGVQPLIYFPFQR